MHGRLVHSPSLYKDQLQGPPVYSDPMHGRQFHSPSLYKDQPCIRTTCLQRPPPLGPLSGHYRQVSLYTVKPVYSNQSKDQVVVVSVDRQSLYGGALVQLKWAMSHPIMLGCMVLCLFCHFPYMYKLVHITHAQMITIDYAIHSSYNIPTNCQLV